MTNHPTRVIALPYLRDYTTLHWEFVITISITIPQFLTKLSWILMPVFRLGFLAEIKSSNLMGRMHSNPHYKLQDFDIVENLYNPYLRIKPTPKWRMTAYCVDLDRQRYINWMPWDHASCRDIIIFATSKCKSRNAPFRSSRSRKPANVFNTVLHRGGEGKLDYGWRPSLKPLQRR